MIRLRLWFFIMILCAGAVFLDQHFIDISARDLKIYPDSVDVIMPNSQLILDLGTTWREPNSSDRSFGLDTRILAKRGVYARDGYSHGAAILGGIILPVSLIGLAVCLFIRGYSNKT